MTILYLCTILLVYAAIAFGRVPRLRMNRATIALVGAALLVAMGAISEEDAFHAVDVGTLLLLGAMMVINVNLRLAGFFEWVTVRVLPIARTPRVLLALVIGASGVLSALFLNDTICLMLTPLVVRSALRLQRNPVPYLIGLATAANVGSVATITGNPQNIIIGQNSGLGYVTFAAYLTPVALIGLAVCWLVVVLLYPSEFRGTLPNPPYIQGKHGATYPPLLNRSLLVVLGMLIAFLVGLPIVTTACVAAALLLVSRLRPLKLLTLDWDLLAFFAGLFVITEALVTTGISEAFFKAGQGVLTNGVPGLTLITAALSNGISNVPAVLLLQTSVAELANPQQAWLTLAMASTLAGNLTLLGSAATLIVAELAQHQGVRLSFVEYLRAGVPITIITLLIGVGWLMLTTG